MRALTELTTVGTKLAAMSATLLFIYTIREGLADAFTKDFVRIVMVAGAALAVGAAYTAYRMIERMAEAAEEAALALADKAKAEAEAEKLKQQIQDKKATNRVVEMQAQFNALLVASMSQQRPALGAPKAGAPRGIRRNGIQVEIQETAKSATKNAFVVK